jgi:hypothetical protein
MAFGNLPHTTDWGSKVKISINADDRRKLTVARLALKSARTKFQTASEVLEKLKNRSHKVESRSRELSRSLAADGQDDAEFQKLKSESELLPRKIQTAEKEFADADEKLVEEFRLVGRELAEIFRREYPPALEKIADVFAPYFMDRLRAVVVARQTDTARRIIAQSDVLGNGMVSATVEAAAARIELCERLLAGLNPFGAK